MTKKLSETLLIVGPVRFSYLNVFKPRFNDVRKKEEYSVTLLIPKEANEFNKEPAKTVKAINDAITAALVEKFGKIPPKYENYALQDGDKETDNEGKPKAPGYYFLGTRSGVEYPPHVMGPDRQPVLDATKWVSGDWGYAKVSVYGYEFEGKKGVSTGLRAIQFTKKDEPLGSAQDFESVANEFDTFEEEELLG